METIGTRIRAFRESRNLTQKDIFQATRGEIKQTTLSAIENGQAKPGFDTLAALLDTYPELSSDWLLRGTGPMLRDGRTLAPVAAPLPVATAVLPAQAPADTLAQFLTLLSEREAELKKEAKAARELAARAHAYTIARMQKENATQEADIHYLRGMLGHRPPTAQELENQRAQAAKTPAPIAGFTTDARRAEPGAKWCPAPTARYATARLAYAQ